LLVAASVRGKGTGSARRSFDAAATDRRGYRRETIDPTESRKIDLSVQDFGPWLRRRPDYALVRRAGP
jgi:hypothetical protein